MGGFFIAFRCIVRAVLGVENTKECRDYRLAVGGAGGTGGFGLIAALAATAAPIHTTRATQNMISNSNRLFLMFFILVYG